MTTELDYAAQALTTAGFPVTPDELAAVAFEATEWMVTADNRVIGRISHIGGQYAPFLGEGSSVRLCAGYADWPFTLPEAVGMLFAAEREAVQA
ncbi:MAG: hypothetical protein QM804_10185 [Propionicimonas sp.]